MKWSLFELEQMNQINETVESFVVPEGYVDVKSISNIKVNGSVNQKIDGINLNLTISCDIVMLCAITLKEVDVPILFNLDLLFGPTVASDYELTNPLELDEIVLGNILVEKPFRVFHETADRSQFELKKEPHPAFAELEDLLKD